MIVIIKDTLTLPACRYIGAIQAMQTVMVGIIQVHNPNPNPGPNAQSSLRMGIRALNPSELGFTKHPPIANI